MNVMDTLGLDQLDQLLEIFREQWAGARLPCSQPHAMYHMLFSCLYSISWNGRLPLKSGCI